MITHHNFILIGDAQEHNLDMDVEEAASGAWSRVDVDSEKPADLKAGNCRHVQADS